MPLVHDVFEHKVLDSGVLEQHDPVDDVADGENQSLVPLNQTVPGHCGQHGDVNAEDQAITGQGIPEQLDGFPGGNSCAGCHAQSVEEQSADDCAQTHSRLCYEGADHVGEELGNGSGDGHESGSGHILRRERINWDP